MHIFLTFSFVFLGYAKISSLIVVNNKKNIEVKKNMEKSYPKSLILPQLLIIRYRICELNIMKLTALIAHKVHLKLYHGILSISIFCVPFNKSTSTLKPRIKSSLYRMNGLNLSEIQSCISKTHICKIILNRHPIYLLPLISYRCAFVIKKASSRYSI